MLSKEKALQKKNYFCIFKMNVESYKEHDSRDK